MSFFKCDCQKQIEELKDAIKKLSNDIKDKDLDIQRLQSHMISLRGLVNRKLSVDLPKEEESPSREGDTEEEKNQPKSINMHYY